MEANSLVVYGLSCSIKDFELFYAAELLKDYTAKSVIEKLAFKTLPELQSKILFIIDL